MTLESALTVAIAIFVFGLTPGPGVFAIVARALAQGFRPTMVFVCGIIMGDLVYLVLAALGLSVIASQYASALGLLKIVGGLYLVYLGVQTWRSAKNGDTGLAPVATGGAYAWFSQRLQRYHGQPESGDFLRCVLASVRRFGRFELDRFIRGGGCRVLQLVGVLAALCRDGGARTGLVHQRTCGA